MPPLTIGEARSYSELLPHGTSFSDISAVASCIKVQSGIIGEGDENPSDAGRIKIIEP